MAENPSRNPFDTLPDLNADQAAPQRPAANPFDALPDVTAAPSGLPTDNPFAALPDVIPSDDPGALRLLGRGLARGVTDVGQSVFGTVPRWLGGKLDSDTLQRIGVSGEQWWQAQGAAFEPPADIQGEIFSNPGLLKDSSWWAYNIGNIVPSIAASLLPGKAAHSVITIGGKALKWTPKLVSKLATIGGMATGGLVGGTLEGSATYREVIRRGGTEQEAASAAQLMTLASAGLNALPVGSSLKAAKGLPGRVARFFKTGTVEGVTEWLEEPVEALILGDDVVAAAKRGLNVLPVAFVTGGAGGALVAPSAPATVAEPATSQTGTQAQAAQAMQAGERWKGHITGEEILQRQRGFPEDTVIRREQILKPLMQDLNVPLYQGHIQAGQGVLGYYRRGMEEVRTKNRNDLEVTAHEIAHLIDDRTDLFKKAYRRQPFNEEMRGVSYDAKKLHEGFAEFMRLYLTQEEEAVVRAPKFYEWFTNAIKGTEYETTLSRAQRGMHDWFEQGALKQFISKIGAEPETLQQRFHQWVQNWRDRAIASSLDALHGIKIAQKDLRGDLSGDMNPYRSARLIAGVRMAIRSVYEHGTLRWTNKGDVEFSGKGLRQVFEPVADNMEQVQQYFIARRAAELMKQKRERHFTQEEINAGLKIGEQTPAIKKAFEEWQQFNSRMLDFAEQSGILSKDLRAKFDDMNKDYVPFYRIVEEVTGSRVMKGPGAFRRLRGGTANVNDVLDNVAANVAMIVDASFKNVAKRRFYDMIEKSRGGARYAAPVPKTVQPQFVDKAQLIRKLEEMGVERIPENIEDIVTFFTFGNAPKGSNIDVVMRKGESKYYEVADPLVLKAMQSFSPKHVSLGLRILGGFKTTLTRLVTADPGFMLVNLLRDTGSAFLLSKGSFKPGIDSLRGFTSRLLKDEAYWEAMANGLGFSSFIHGETGILKRELEKFYTKQGIDYRTVLDTPKKFADFWDQFSSGFEYGARLQEYKNLRGQGSSAQQAAFAGREVSTDFAMRGYSDFIRGFTATVPFLGARMQGLYRLARAGLPKAFRAENEGESAMRLALRGTLGIMLPSLLLYALNKDDERYQALPDWIRDLHWVIFVPGSDTPFLIPKPFELGAIFATIPERLFQLIEERDGKEFADSLGWIIAEQMQINIVPQVAKPVFDVMMNETFTGSPIVPADLKDVAPEEQYRPWTSETLVALGKHTNTSPLKMEALLRGYFGTLGSYALMASDAVVRGAGDNEAPTQRLDEIPVVRRFFRSQPLRFSSYEDEFYQLAEETREAVATIRKITAEGRAEDARTFLTDEERRMAFGLEKATNQVASTVAQINRALRVIRLDPNLSAIEKRRRTDKLLATKQQLFKQTVSSIKAAKQQRE